MPSPKLDQLIGSLRPHPDEVRMHRILNDDRDERRHELENEAAAKADIPGADEIIGKLRTLRREVADMLDKSNGYFSDQYNELLDHLSDDAGALCAAIRQLTEGR